MERPNTNTPRFLEEKKQEQIQAAKGWTIFHEFRFDDRFEESGITFEQRRNAVVPSYELLGNVVTSRQDVPEAARRDMLVGLITLKYTQSNSVCLVLGGQVIGNGAGQQSRIHCTRLAAAKADTWYLRQHPAVLSLKFRPGIDRVDRDNAIDQFLQVPSYPLAHLYYCVRNSPRVPL